MIRNTLILIGLFVFAMASSGCRAGGSQAFTQGFGQQQIGSQILQGFQQPILGGNAQQGILGGNAQQPILGGGVQGILGGGVQGIFGGGVQQGTGGLPTGQQAQQTIGNIGQNLGSRISNGVINQGVSRLVNGVFSAL